ncbi:phosphotransferase [Microbacterium ureisolvens]|uniref:phosphotransferase n=1 Tax=Microbacterium ureisolvens TaxID=2781186 RepID=UPI00363E76E7
MRDPAMSQDTEPLGGGAVNDGRVLREGQTVRRPLPANAPTLHALLRFVRSRSDVEVPGPLRVEDRTEILTYVAGEVGLSPYAPWVGTRNSLVTVATLLRRFHDATVGWQPPSDAAWSTAFADPAGGSVICHNDVCIENVVFRDGSAAALIDFDFAAPGRRVWDVAMTARYWVPMTHPTLPAAVERGVEDPVGRLRTFVDAYGLRDGDRRILAGVLLEAEEASRRFVAEQAASGSPAFVAMWDVPARARFDRKLAWLRENSGAITRRLLDTEADHS